MSETFTETRNGITVTVWQSPFSIGVWCFIATQGLKMVRGFVFANDRTRAACLAFEQAEEV